MKPRGLAGRPGGRARATAGLTRTLRPRPARSAALDLAGNDYLGLAHRPAGLAAAAEAAREWGAGSGASRLVTGSLDLHAELESQLAAFCGQPAALAFSSGYHANLGAVTALSDSDTLVVSDAHVHASLVDACRLARGRVQVVPHNDVVAVDDALASRSESRALVLCESVYSVLGDAAPLAALAEVCTGTPPRWSSTRHMRSGSPGGAARAWSAHSGWRRSSTSW